MHPACRLQLNNARAASGRQPMTPAQEAAIARYNERLRLFQKSQGMTEQDWTAQSAKRVRDAAALTGRDTLRQFLQRVGFGLR